MLFIEGATGIELFIRAEGLTPRRSRRGMLIVRVNAAFSRGKDWRGPPVDFRTSVYKNRPRVFTKTR